MLTSKNYKKRVKKLNNYIEINLQEICEISNNNLNEVVENISLIIRFFLETSLEPKNVLETITLAKTINPSNSYFLTPSYSYLEKKEKLYGINPDAIFLISKQKELRELDSYVSVYPYKKPKGYIEISHNISAMIRKAFHYPNVLYDSILKQPKGKEIPMILGANKTSYYKSVLDIRLRNTRDLEKETASHLAKRVSKKIIPSNPTLVVFPKKTKYYEITDVEEQKEQTYKYIPRSSLEIINIPSRYTILTLCAQNKKLPPGTLLNITNGDSYKNHELEELPHLMSGYRRIEEIPITDKFIYTNPELTQDISYDIDLIYGALEPGNRRRINLNNVSENIANIKGNTNITLKRRGKKYEIINGRHRILYLKHFYVSHYDEYKRLGKLNELKKYVTIPVYIEAYITDEIANKYINYLCQKFPSAVIYKSDITNDYPNILVILNDNIYYLNGTPDIIDFTNDITNENDLSRYYVAKCDQNSSRKYSILYDSLALNLGEKINNMTLLDMIKYILNNEIKYENRYYRLEKLNLHMLYLFYIDFKHYITLEKIRNPYKSIDQLIEEKYRMKILGYKIIDVIIKIPNFYHFTWNEIYDIIKNNQEFSIYGREYLLQCVSVVGYQSTRLDHIISNSNEELKKKL